MVGFNIVIYHQWAFFRSTQDVLINEGNKESFVCLVQLILSRSLIRKTVVA